MQFFWDYIFREKIQYPIILDYMRRKRIHLLLGRIRSKLIGVQSYLTFRDTIFSLIEYTKRLFAIWLIRVQSNSTDFSEILFFVKRIVERSSKFRTIPYYTEIGTVDDTTVNYSLYDLTNYTETEFWIEILHKSRRIRAPRWSSPFRPV